MYLIENKNIDKKEFQREYTNNSYNETRLSNKYRFCALLSLISLSVSVSFIPVYISLYFSGQVYSLISFLIVGSIFFLSYIIYAIDAYKIKRRVLNKSFTLIFEMKFDDFIPTPNKKYFAEAVDEKGTYIEVVSEGEEK
ncbi:hypothetical protein ACPUEX_22370 [Enterobacter vonholyi]